MYQGPFRLLLAMMIIVAHFFPTGPMPGRIAVFGFYLASGYLITRVLNERYTGPGGLARFAINRFLRIYPTYLLILSFAFLVLVIIGGSNPGTDFRLPVTAGEWIRQFTIIGLNNFTGGLYKVRVIEPGFSLAIEISHYALIALIGRWRLAVRIWWACALCIAAYYSWTNDFWITFLSYWGPSFMFASGAMMYYESARIDRLLLRHAGTVRAALISSLVMLAFCYTPLTLAGLDVLFRHQTVAAAKAAHSLPSVLMLYGSIIVVLPAFYMSLHTRRDPKNPLLTKRAQKICDFCRDVTYPLFIIHLPILDLVQSVLPQIGPLGARALSVPLSLAAGGAVVFLTEEPIQKIRDKFRPAAAAQPASAASGVPANADTPVSDARPKRRP